MRKFEDVEATRERVPLLVGVYGPSGTGKTYSALRLATGMQKVVGGDVFVIDTEARRALHYADRFKFRHVPFGAPFDPEAYMGALEHCAKRSARVVVVDNMSHEHEGQGGVLEMHDAELARIAGDDYSKRERCKMLAWQRPKAARRKLVHAVLQLGISAVFCFRAKEKLKLGRGKEPEQLGWMPIAGDEFIFEMTATALLLPGASGVPTWNPGQEGERAMVKRPQQFDSLFRRHDGQPLSEDIGEAMARWADGKTGDKVKEYRDALDAAGSEAVLKTTWGLVNEAAKSGKLTPADVRDLETTKDRRKAELVGAVTTPA